MARKAKTVEIVERAASLTFPVTKVYAYENDMIRLEPTESEIGIGAKTYKWYNGASGTTVMDGETKSYIIVKASDTTGNKYHCSVTVGSTETKTSTPAEVIKKAAPAGLTKVANFKNNVFDGYLRCPIMWHIALEMLTCATTVSDPTSDDNLTKKLQTRIDELVAQKKLLLASQLYTYTSLLLENSNFIGQESRHGYYVAFNSSMKKTDIKNSFYGSQSFNPKNGSPDFIDWWPTVNLSS